jgi:hypothetical protein
MTDNSGRDVLSCLDSFFSLHTQADGEYLKIAAKKRRNVGDPETHTKQKIDPHRLED